MTWDHVVTILNPLSRLFHKTDLLESVDHSP
jgi:hypothetical protein